MDGSQIGCRDYRILVALSQRFEITASVRVCALMTQEEFWKFLPLRNYTIFFRNRNFVMLSKFFCGMERYLLRPLRRFPKKLFMLLLDGAEGLWESFAALCPQELGRLAAAFFEKYPSPCAEGYCKLQFMAWLNKVDGVAFNTFVKSPTRQNMAAVNILYL